MTIEAGRVLNERYRLIRPVGQGSQASVWVAEHLALSTQVAVKLIDRELAKKDDARERFRREATAAAQLRSAHVVQILDHGIDGEQPFIVMELLDGEDLFERLQRRVRLSLQETSRVITQVARALTRAHGAGIVHRDLKPENVFLIPNEDDEIVKVLDFGVAKVIDPAKTTMQRTGIGTLIGTPHYMSPEQVKGITEVDYRSDLWSLGIIAYQCVTGEMPFDSEGVGDLLIKITLGDMPVPSKVVSTLPGTFDAWFAKSCHREPTRRFETAREQADALARAVGLLPEDESTNRRLGPLERPKSVPRPTSAPDAAETPGGDSGAGASPPAEPRDTRESALPMPLVARSKGGDGHHGDHDEEGETDIDAAAPVMESHRPPLDSTDIDVEESVSANPPPEGARHRATGTPLPRAPRPGRLPHDLTAEAADTDAAHAMPAASARSLPRTTVSGVSGPGAPPVLVTPPELDGSRRKRLLGLVAFGFLALALVVTYRAVQPYLGSPTSAAAPEEAPPAPMPSTDPTGPGVTSIDPGPGALQPGKKAPSSRPAATTSGKAGARKGRPAPKGSGKDPVIEYDVPPDDSAAPKDHGAEP
jgi:serine/threonine-protein kinase